MSKTETDTPAARFPGLTRRMILLGVVASGLPVTFSTWDALVNNYVIDVLGFNGVDIGLLHTFREIPGFLAIAVIGLLVVFREQPLMLFTLAMFGLATALTALLPSLGWMLMITFVASIGFHFHATLYESLQLQWLPKDRAPQLLGWYMAIGSGATLLAYIMIILTWERFDLSYELGFGVAGGFSVMLALIVWLAFPQFRETHVQNTHMVLRRRYWLYYALRFMSGARRQIFVVFAGFMMVERFGFGVEDIASLYLINLVASTLCAPVIGKLVAYWGERRALIVEYIGLILVFVSYAGVYLFELSFVVAAGLYVVDHLLFAMAIAMKTYFQKIADPADIAPTSAVSFTINHIAAVALPVPLGLMWVASPPAVFVTAAFLAFGSFVLALCVPRHPQPGHETRAPFKVAA